MITGNTYKLLKFFVQIFLPVVGTLYFAYAQIWGLANIEVNLGIIIVLDALLGIFLSISQARHNKEVLRGGVLLVTRTDDYERYTLEIANDPEILKTKREVWFDIRLD
jgi:hypothetical protein